MKSAAVRPTLDVKVMNRTASVLFMAFGVLIAAAAAWWVVRHPLFAIGAITVEGEVTHNSAPTLRANVAPRLAGNFFTVDLNQAKEVFQSVPWVRTATVRRQFPNRLRVKLEEHHAEAFWGPDSESRMVNSFGEVFEANVGDLEQEDLPRLQGPEGESAQVLAMYRLLEPLFEPLDLAVEQLTLTGRGSWTLQLDTSAVVELGRGSQDEIVARARRFTQTLTQVTSKYGRRPDALVSADLRHADGYALRMRGVTTTPTGPAQRN